MLTIFSQLLPYSFALWLALYTLTRANRNPGMIFAGLGLLSYCLVLLIDTFNIIDQQHWARTLLAAEPALCWLGAIFYLLPSERRLILRPLHVIAPIITAIFIVIITQTPLISAIPIAIMLVALWHVFLQFRVDESLPQIPIAALLAATLFFTLGTGISLLPSDFFAQDMVQLAMGFDFLMLGYGVIALDAYNNGENFQQDAIRSLLETALAVLVFAFQIVVIATIEDLATETVMWLLTAAITTAILFQTLSTTLQTFIDRATLPESIQVTRTALRTASDATLRSKSLHELLEIEPDEFYKVVRRALSDMHDPGRLAASPLTQLPHIDQAITIKNIEDTTLARGLELRTLLTDRIMMLKPSDTVTFGTTDEWRYYNALYYPYVAGIKPYSRRFYVEELDDDTKSAVNWFRSQVPERTLYNWQKSGAQIIADNLMETIEN